MAGSGRLASRYVYLVPKMGGGTCFFRLSSFNVPTNDPFLIVARGYHIS